MEWSDGPCMEEHTLVVMPAGTRVAYPNQELPTVVCNSVDAVLSHAGRGRSVH